MDIFVMKVELALGDGARGAEDVFDCGFVATNHGKPQAVAKILGEGSVHSVLHCEGFCTSTSWSILAHGDLNN